jgi:hypothetical protein
LKEKQGNAEFLKADVVAINAKLVDLQELFYDKLNEIKQQHDELLKFTHRVQMQTKEQKNAQKILIKLKCGKQRIKSVPESVSRMTDKEKIQIQASLDAWFSNCDFSQDLIKETNKNCSDLWDSTVDIIEDHDMPHVQFLGQTVPLSNCLTDVNQQKKSCVDRITQA